MLYAMTPELCVQPIYIMQAIIFASFVFAFGMYAALKINNAAYMPNVNTTHKCNGCATLQLCRWRIILSFPSNEPINSRANFPALFISVQTWKMTVRAGRIEVRRSEMNSRDVISASTRNNTVTRYLLRMSVGFGIAIVDYINLELIAAPVVYYNHAIMRLIRSYWTQYIA